MSPATEQAVLPTRPSALPGFTTTERRIVPPLTVAVRRRGGDEASKSLAFDPASPHWSRQRSGRQRRMDTICNGPPSGEDCMGATEKPTLDEVVREHGSFIRKTLSQLGVDARSLPDVEQEVLRAVAPADRLKFIYDNLPLLPEA